MRIMASSLAIVAKAVLLIFRIPPSLPTASATGIPNRQIIEICERYDATSQLRSRHTSRNRERIREIHAWTAGLTVFLHWVSPRKHKTAEPAGVTFLSG